MQKQPKLTPRQEAHSRAIAKRERLVLPRMIIGYVAVEGVTKAGERAVEIKALPEVEWKGRWLKSLTCSVCGQIRNVPESVCWALISVTHYECRTCTQKG